VKEDRLVHHHRCCCVERGWTWDGGERKWQRWVELWWRGALAREEVKWRCDCVVGTMTKIEMPFYISGEWKSSCSGRVADDSGADLMFWFRLERGRWRDEVLSKDEADVMSSSWSMGRKCDIARRRGDIGRRRGGTGEGKGRRRRQLGWHKFYWAKK
jgi:hypothetical protein